jgi:hypothetical protein
MDLHLLMELVNKLLPKLINLIVKFMLKALANLEDVQNVKKDIIKVKVENVFLFLKDVNKLIDLELVLYASKDTI